MAAGGLEQPITRKDGWFRGEDKTLRFTIYDAAGAVQNLTGWSVKFDLQPNQGDAPTFTKTASLDDAVNGICSVAISAADTTASGPVDWYQLYRDDTGQKQVLAYGPAVVQDR